MFYRAIIIKKERNSKSIAIRATSREQVEEMIPQIKEFLYPDEDSSNYNYHIYCVEVEPFGPGVKVPEYQITVYKPRETKHGEIDDVSAENASFFEETLEAESVEEAREKILLKKCPYSVGYDNCLIFINEVPVSMLLGEEREALINLTKTLYLEAVAPGMSIRDHHKMFRDMETDEKLKYEALKYVTSALRIAGRFDYNEVDLEKMSAREYIDTVNKLSMLKDREEYNKLFEEVKAKYRK